MLIDKDLRLSISGCFWLFYASKYIKGFPYFCQESNIKGDNVEDSPQLIVRKDSEIGFFFDNSDPNEGVNF